MCTVLALVIAPLQIAFANPPSEPSYLVPYQQNETKPASDTPADITKAIEVYNSGQIDLALNLAKEAANKGSTDGAVMAGHILRKGETGVANYSEARSWYEKAAIFNHPDALVALGEMGIRGQGGLTKVDAVSFLTRASDMGRTDAMRALSDLYRTGQGVSANAAQSQEYLEKAAQSFDAEATKRLGDSLFEDDPKTALTHYETAAAAGHIEAAYIAGVMYAQNYNIRPNSARSATLLQQAAMGGHAAAQADYGLLVYQGYGATRSETEAAEWFRKSAEGGDKEGQFLYAFTLAKGEGTTQDFESAYYWLLKSSEGGNAGIDDYDKDREALQQRLEENVDPAILEKARARL